MKKLGTTSLIVLGIILLIPPVVLAQGVFQNLDFESAHNLPVPSGIVATSNALPGWTASAGTNSLATIPYNDVFNTPVVGLYGSNSPANSNIVYLGGSYSAFVGNGGTISQTGMIPADSQFLLFKAWGTMIAPHLPIVFLDGQSLRYYTLSSQGTAYTVYGADVFAFAGRTSTLSFRGAGFTGLLDDVLFSPDIIPEPSAWALAGVGALLFAARHRRRQL